jgi:hypothetical protein
MFILNTKKALNLEVFKRLIFDICILNKAKHGFLTIWNKPIIIMIANVFLEISQILLNKGALRDIPRLSLQIGVRPLLNIILEV